MHRGWGEASVRVRALSVGVQRRQKGALDPAEAGVTGACEEIKVGAAALLGSSARALSALPSELSLQALCTDNFKKPFLVAMAIFASPLLLLLLLCYFSAGGGVDFCQHFFCGCCLTKSSSAVGCRWLLCP